MTVLVVANMRRQRVNHLARHGVRSVAARAPGRVRGPGRGVGSIPTGLIWLVSWWDDVRVLGGFQAGFCRRMTKLTFAFCQPATK